MEWTNDGDRHSMIRIGLYPKIVPCTPSFLPLWKRLRVLLETEEGGLNRLIESGDCDVMILDFPSSDLSLSKHIEAAGD